ncbi:hypothetical protein [Streptomyces seoulensis]|nr:hypothetical protein [Streptomyces seoulensis]BDH04873.1 hypothetical protein HEK131_21000 [Streptomyces seoulensis]
MTEPAAVAHLIIAALVSAGIAVGCLAAAAVTALLDHRTTEADRKNDHE